MLTYNKTGRSTGVATIIFNQANLGAAAAKQFNGVKVDGKPMKVHNLIRSGSSDTIS